LSDIIHIMESQSFQIVGLDLFDIFLILLTEDQFLDSGTFGCQYLFLDATYRKDFTPQRDLAGHSQITAHLTLRKSRHQRCDHRDTRTRTVFRNRTLRYMDMDIPVFEHTFVNTE